MEDFQLDDFDLNFDFNRDFDRDENQIINEILNEPLQFGPSTSDFDPSTAVSFLGNETNYSIENFNDSFSGFSNLDPVNFSTDFYSSFQLNVENPSSTAVAETYQISSDAIESFDWSAFLQKSPHHEVIVEENEMPVDIRNPIEMENQSDDVIVYEELQDLNVVQMYNNVKSKFELMELKSIDEDIDYDDLLKRTIDARAICNRKNEKQQRIFFLPTNYPVDEKSDALMNKLQNDPSIADSLLKQQSNATANNSNQIVIKRQPKQIKQKSTKFLTITEQLAQIDRKEFDLVNIEKVQVKHLRKSQAAYMPRQTPINQTIAVPKKPLMCNRKSGQRANTVPVKDQSTELLIAKERRRSQRTRQ